MAESTAHGLAASGLPPYSKDDIYIAVMGVTGAGKSSFISRCCPNAINIIGEDLDSFTKSCMVYTLNCKGKTVHLIDTPGFNDTSRRDTDVLRELATWLAASYEKDTRLNGLIYLHGIHEARMKGSDVTHLRMFRNLTGIDNMEFVILATSYWDVTPDKTGEAREKMLRDNDNFWKIMEDSGAKIMRFRNDEQSALGMVGYIAEKEKKTTLEIQNEMSVEHKLLGQTAAGMELDSELNKHLEQAKQKWDEEQAELNKALKEKNEQGAREAMDAQEELNKLMVSLKTKQESLEVGTAQLLKEKDDEIKRIREETQSLRDESQRAGEEHKRQLDEKDKESERKIEERDRMWEEGLTRAAESVASSIQSHQQQREAPQESMEEMVRRVWREEEAKKQPPPYSSYSQQAFPPQQYAPGPVVYQQPPPVQYNMDPAATAAGVGMVGGSIAAMTAIGMGCVMM